jgi:predicted metal-dependent hydrolase
LLDHGFPWEAHELLELLWRAATGADRRLLQGLIQIGAAQVRHQAGDLRAARTLLARATEHANAGNTSAWWAAAAADARLAALEASLRANDPEPASTLRERPPRG